MRPLKMWPTHSSEKYGSSMDYQRKLYPTWTPNSQENFGNRYASRWALRERCRQHTTRKPMDRPRGQTRRWKDTYGILSTMTKTTGTNSFRWPSTHIITRLQTLMECPRSMPTMGSTHKRNG